MEPKTSFVLETAWNVAQARLKFAVLPRITLNLGSSCLYLQNAGIKGVCHHKGIVHASQVLY